MGLPGKNRSGGAGRKGRSAARPAAAKPQVVRGSAPASRSVKQAYYKLSGGQPSVRVELSDLREALPKMSRAKLDRKLGKLAARGSVALYANQNPAEHLRNRALGARRDAAAWYTPTGHRRDYIHIGGSKS